MGLLRDIHRSKDYFFHKLTSSRFTHVFYYKREKNMCLFCFNDYLAIFLPTVLFIPSWSTFIVC